MSTNMTAEISEVSIDYDGYADLNVTVKKISQSDTLKVQVNDLTINMNDRVALEILMNLAEHYKWKLVDLDENMSVD